MDAIFSLFAATRIGASFRASVGGASEHESGASERESGESEHESGASEHESGASEHESGGRSRSMPTWNFAISGNLAEMGGVGKRYR